jgi:hypothetical protein
MKETERSDEKGVVIRKFRPSDDEGDYGIMDLKSSTLSESVKN